MKRILFSMILSLCMFVGIPSAQSTLQSIEKLTVFSIDQMLGTIETEYCTAFSINKLQGYWLTAGHCKGDGYIIGEQKDIREIRFDKSLDLMILFGPRVEALRWESRTPKAGDEIHLSGYLEAMDILWTVYGKVVFPLVSNIEGDYWPSNMVLDVRSGGGMSGGPVFSKRGRVIGVHQGGWYTRTGNKFSLDAPYAVVKTFTEDMWNR